MYYTMKADGKNGNFLPNNQKLPRQPSCWQICLVLLVGPTLMATMAVLVAIHIEHLDVYSSYLGG